MNQTDKNIELAKECFAAVDNIYVGDAYHSSVITFRGKELDEYTSRVCAEKGAEVHKHYAEKEWETCGYIAKLAEKDTLIAMQAKALKSAIHALRFAGAPMSLLESLVDARTATVETVEAWKNKQGDRK